VSKEKRNADPPVGSTCRCWAHFGWSSEVSPSPNIEGHCPHIAKTESELVERYGREPWSAVVPVEIRILQKAKEGV